MRNYLLLLVSIFTVNASAQLSNELKLKNNHFTPENNLEEYISSVQLGKRDLVQDKYYKIIQFEEMPSNKERQALKDSGIELLSYIPNKAYVASFPVGFNPDLLKSLSIRYIHNLDPKLKLSDKIQARDIPSYAKVGRDHIEVLMMYPEDMEHEEVLELAEADGIEVRDHNGENNFFSAYIAEEAIDMIGDLPYVLYVELRPAPSVPDDTPGRALIRANMIDSPSPMGRKYDGTGVAVVCRDDGEVFDHVDFHGRLFQEFVGPDRGNHGDGVAGIMSGAGNRDPRNRGMAAGSDLYVLDYVSNFLDETMSLHNNQNALVTNSSYSDGCNAGYTNTTRIVDQQCYDNPTLLHVFSAGNSNNQDCDYGAGSQWGNITGGHKQGKNVIATANVTNRGLIVESSSRGPAFDGRIKPDLASNGFSHLSTDDFHGYRPFGGTSGAAPGIAGVTAMLHQAYRETNNGEIANGALLKAIMLNTADDLGNKGPDFIFGWGTANAFRAALAVEQGNHELHEINQDESVSHTISVPAGAREVRIMTYWADPEASVFTDKALVNDIESSVVAPDGSTHLPWVLLTNPIPELLALPAERGTDDLNNVEQVLIENPEAGEYTLDLFGSVIPSGTHNYYITWEIRMDEVTMVYPYGGEQLNSGNETIYWESGPNGDPHTISFSDDSGTTWIELETVGATAQSAIISLPSVITNTAHIRIERSGIETISEPFTIAPIPSNLQILEVCGNDMLVKWDAVTDAVSYDVYTLGQKYMEVELNTVNTETRIPISNPFEEQWFAVSANFANDVKGRRSLARNHDGESLVNCKLDFDMAMDRLDNPNAGHLITCNSITDEPLTVQVINSGNNPFENVTINYQLNDGPVISEVYPTTIAVNDTVSYTFDQPINLVENGDYSIKAWVAHPEEELFSNDTIFIEGPVYVDAGQNLPLEENFGARTIPTFWRTDSEDRITWSPLAVTQRNGFVGGTLTMPFENYPNNADLDYLNLVPLDLSAVTGTTILDFNLAYSYNNIGDDGLLVEVSTDCGTTFQDTLFERYGGELATSFTTFEFPENTYHWTQHSIDLSQYNGLNKVLIRFTGVNDSGSNLYLDNINVSETQLSEPTCDLSVNRSEVCKLRPVILTGMGDGGLLDYSWEFGLGGLPATSDQAGPHELSYIIAGTKTITLTVNNALGSCTTTQNIEVIDVPSGGWNFEEIGSGEVQFNSNFTNATLYQWDFGDGDIGFGAEPRHAYSSPGEYEVSLRVSNMCGQKVLASTITVMTSSINELDNKLSASIAPNPNQGNFLINLEGEIRGEVKLNVINTSGQVVDTRVITLTQANTRVAYQNEDLNAGIYYLEFANALGHKTIKMVVMD